MTMAAAGGPRLPLLLMLLLLLTVAQAQAIRDGRALRRGGGREKQVRKALYIGGSCLRLAAHPNP